MNQPTILLTDDDVEDQELFTEAIHSIDPGIKVEHLNSGKALLAYLDQMDNKDYPCLIVLDYSMPFMTGHQVLEAMAADQRFDGIPRVIWSTAGGDRFRNECLESGARQYFVKPASFSAITGVAQEMIGLCRERGVA